MTFLKKIDNYLLRHYPALWVTRLHSFLPIGLLLLVVIYITNISLVWNPKEDLPIFEASIFFMLVPVLVYLVYWFIFQSRYNVLKSGGKNSIVAEYGAFFAYVLVFFVAYLFILIIPISNNQRVKRNVSELEIRQDYEKLNLGNALVNEQYNIIQLDNGTYEVRNEEYSYYWKYNFFDEKNAIEILTERQVLNRIENYIIAHNKYTTSTIDITPQRILADINNVYSSADYAGYNHLDPEVYYESDWNVETKVHAILRMYNEGWFSGDFGLWFWKISLGFIGMLALLVWMFKQMTLRYFVIGFISLCLTPLLVGLVALLLFDVLYFRGIGGELIAIYLILFAYIFVGIFAARGYLQKTLNPTANVLTMYFNFWLPFLPLFLILSAFSHGNFYGYEIFQTVEPDFVANTVYWSCIVLLLFSILIFKPVYAKFRALPAKK